MWLRTFFSSGLSKYVLTDKSARGDGHGNHTPVVQIWYRILSNLVAAVLVALSLAALAVVVAQGTFRREDVQYHDQAKASYWNSYGASCKLNHAGWVPHSCSAIEVNTTANAVAWNAIGANVAARLAIPAGATYSVSTCFMGATPEIGWASLQLLIGYDDFPTCCPQNGSQTIAGLFMVETALRMTHPEGVYLVTGFIDKVTTTTKVYTSTDGSTHRLVAGVETMQVALNGTTAPDPIGRNTEIPSFPLGRRYAVSSHNQAVMVAIFDDLDTDLGWSTGRDSKIPVVSGWIVGHSVDNGDELLAMQIASCATSPS
ncbi:hypothetical protein SDRG_10477 [Saprolegnia diclina VS20]|uniref:Uncharacterized protein n=1 Tax=Saprolegnia diclina (strain VS20) TaxID=1156394 RepID=T0RI58_SAPDV|nr:hypothetical protein SDRG_10477 [Saprolegnia diclina VS20]EQC31963.1 hypothetical protein SDRG_10477 [Saprolegnia diclina VS20]|eukprot:XP_008614691.1 hypothetical protein SDRG_10477 [Saprolegnia diclina VS20]